MQNRIIAFLFDGQFGVVNKPLRLTCIDDDRWEITNVTVEKTSNKVTSISSSSTNNQYPSAKCVYDELTDKADTSLSNLSSTGQKVIDGQWVASELELSTATAIDTYRIDLASYLPDTTSIYEVLVSYTIGAKATSVSDTKIYSDKMSISTNYMRQKTSSTSHSIFNGCLIIIPVQRYLYYQISNHATDSTNITVVGYRRIGTNS